MLTIILAGLAGLCLLCLLVRYFELGDRLAQFVQDVASLDGETALLTLFLLLCGAAAVSLAF